MPASAPVTPPSKPQAVNPHEDEIPISYDINIPYVDVAKESTSHTRYPEYLPTWDKVWFDPLPPFKYEDPALRVKDKSKRNLLTPGVKVSHIQPQIGSIVEGVQLSQLSDAAKDELALLVAERKVVAFPAQDLIDAGPEKLEQFMRHFGKPNYQPVSGTVRDHPGFHIIHRDGNREEIARFLEQRTTTTLWHQDVSYEIQPPGYVMLGLLEGPEVGGDTVFAATDMAYKYGFPPSSSYAEKQKTDRSRRLSPTFTSFLDGLRAVHSSAKMINHTRLLGGLVRKDPVDTVHPLVRIHPVTGEKCLFINGEFITRIQGLKEPEQRYLLDFLMQHIMTGHDFQARVRWQPKTIVIFDNRCTIRKLFLPSHAFSASFFAFWVLTFTRLRDSRLPR